MQEIFEHRPMHNNEHHQRIGLMSLERCHFVQTYMRHLLRLRDRCEALQLAYL